MPACNGSLPIYAIKTKEQLGYSESLSKSSTQVDSCGDVTPMETSFPDVPFEKVCSGGVAV